MRPDGPRDPIAGPDVPEPPFPLKLSGKVIKGFGRGSKEVSNIFPLVFFSLPVKCVAVAFSLSLYFSSGPRPPLPRSNCCLQLLITPTSWVSRQWVWLGVVDAFVDGESAAGWPGVREERVQDVPLGLEFWPCKRIQERGDALSLCMADGYGSATVESETRSPWPVWDEGVARHVVTSWFELAQPRANFYS